MSPNNKTTSTNNITDVVTSNKVHGQVTYNPRAITATRTTIPVSLRGEASTVDQTNDFNGGSKDDSCKEDNVICCELTHHVTGCEVVERISASSVAMSYAYENRVHSFGYCVDEDSENENQIYSNLYDYDLIKSAIISENDRLNIEVDEFLELNSLLGDDDIADLLMASTQNLLS
jgi:hypothetical protein